MTDGRKTLVVFPNWKRAAAFGHSIATRGTYRNLTLFAADKPEQVIHKAKGFERVIFDREVFYQFSPEMKEWINDTRNRTTQG